MTTKETSKSQRPVIRKDRAKVFGYAEHESRVMRASQAVGFALAGNEIARSDYFEAMFGEKTAYTSNHMRDLMTVVQVVAVRAAQASHQEELVQLHANNKSGKPSAAGRLVSFSTEEFEPVRYQIYEEPGNVALKSWMGNLAFNFLVDGQSEPQEVAFMPLMSYVNRPSKPHGYEPLQPSKLVTRALDVGYVQMAIGNETYGRLAG